MKCNHNQKQAHKESNKESSEKSLDAPSVVFELICSHDKKPVVPLLWAKGFFAKRPLEHHALQENSLVGHCSVNARHTHTHNLSLARSLSHTRRVCVFSKTLSLEELSCCWWLVAGVCVFLVFLRCLLLFPCCSLLFLFDIVQMRTHKRMFRTQTQNTRHNRSTSATPRLNSDIKRHSPKKESLLQRRSSRRRRRTTTTTREMRVLWCWRAEDEHEVERRKEDNAMEAAKPVFSTATKPKTSAENCKLLFSR